METLKKEKQDAAKQAGKPGASGGFASESGSQSSKTASGISGGAVVITDESKQLETGKSAEAVLASLDRGVTSESLQEAAGVLAKGWDAQQLQKEVDAQVAITQKFSEVAPKKIADFAEDQVKKLKKQKASSEEIGKWEEGGIYRVALHAVSGGLSGGLSGAMGSGVVAGSANLLQSLQDNSDLLWCSRASIPRQRKP